jgi:hypothetical protein
VDSCATIIAQTPSRISRSNGFYVREILGKVPFRVTFNGDNAMDAVGIATSFEEAVGTPKELSSTIRRRLAALTIEDKPNTDNPFPGSGIVGKNARSRVTWIIENREATESILDWYMEDRHSQQDVLRYMNKYFNKACKSHRFQTADAEKFMPSRGARQLTRTQFEQAIAFEDRNPAKVSREEDRTHTPTGTKRPDHTRGGYRVHRLIDIASTPYQECYHGNDDCT